MALTQCGSSGCWMVNPNHLPPQQNRPRHILHLRITVFHLPQSTSSTQICLVVSWLIASVLIFLLLKLDVLRLRASLNLNDTEELWDKIIHQTQNSSPDWDPASYLTELVSFHSALRQIHFHKESPIIPQLKHVM